MSVRLKGISLGLAIAIVCAAAAATAQDASQDPEIQRLNLQRQRDEAAITAYQKEKARIEAEVAARMAAVNALPEAKANDTKINEKANAGIAEARILSAQQLTTVARLIANEVAASQRVIILTADQKPDLGRLREYEARRARVVANYAEVLQRRGEEVEQEVEGILDGANPPRGLSEMSLATATSGVALLVRLSGLLQRSYDIGGADVTTMNSAYLANAVASVLASDPNRTVFVGWDWMGENAYRSVVEHLTELDGQRVLTARLLTRVQQKRATFSRAAEATRDEALKSKYTRAAQAYGNFDAELTNALNQHELFFTWLTAAGPNNTEPPYTTVVRQAALSAEMNQANVLVVQVHNATQGNMVERSLWTFFGGPPFSVAASASVTARTVNAATGATTFSAAYGCDSPYTRMNEIHERARRGENLVTCRKLT